MRAFNTLAAITAHNQNDNVLVVRTNTVASWPPSLDRWPANSCCNPCSSIRSSGFVAFTSNLFWLRNQFSLIAILILPPTEFSQKILRMGVRFEILIIMMGRESVWQKPASQCKYTESTGIPRLAFIVYLYGVVYAGSVCSKRERERERDMGEKTLNVSLI